MLVFAALTPNSPLLLPAINEARANEVAGTRQALEELANDLYAAKPDTLVIIGEGKTMYPDAFLINVSDPYEAKLTEFGDLGYHKEYQPDLAFIDKLQRYLRQIDQPVSLATEAINFSATVPLHFLTAHLPLAKIVVVSPSELDAKDHFTFGSALKHVILESNARVAVIASGDMSHALSDDSPAGHHQNGELSDEHILACIREKNTAGLLQMPPDLHGHAHDASYKQLCILFGVLDGVSVTPSILSYDCPFGVGYGVANFVL